MTFFFHFSKQLFISDICMWKRGSLGDFPWLVFTHWPCLQTLLLVSTHFFIFASSSSEFFLRTCKKKITSNMHMGCATCFYIFIIEMQACLCTWHWGCPCIKCFWQRLGRFPGATTPPLVQSSPEFVLVTTSELWD